MCEHRAGNEPRVRKTQYTRDLKDKETVSSPFLIKYSAVAVGKNGKPYMNLIFMDKAGEIEARLWDDVNQYVGQAVRDAFVFVEGRCQNYQGRRQVVVSKMQILREDEVDTAELLPESLVDPDRLYAQLLEYVASMQDPFYKALADKGIELSLDGLFAAVAYDAGYLLYRYTLLLSYIVQNKGHSFILSFILSLKI